MMKNTSKIISQILSLKLVVLTLFSICCVNYAHSQTEPKIVLLSPIGGERLIEHQQYTVAWNVLNYEGNIDIFLWDRVSKQSKIVATNIPAQQRKYTWLIPENFASRDYILSISAVNTSVVNDKSNGYFTISKSTTSSVPTENQEQNIDNQGILLTVRNSLLTIQCSIPSDIESVTISSLRGKKALEYTTKYQQITEATFPVDNLSVGPYIAVVKFGNGRIVSKIFIKMK